MSCFFIGPSDRQIFAVLSEPRRTQACNKLVVLCYPFGQEYMRAHRAYRQLANLLARSGVASLRFDYPATGDSYGDAPVESLVEFMADLERVVTTVKDRIQVTEIGVVGLRFGALIAAKMAERIPAVKELYLWDAYSSGSNFVNDCKLQKSVNSEPTLESAVDGTWLVHGFPLSESFRSDLDAIDLRECSFDSGLRIHHTVSHENNESRALLKHFGNRLNQVIVPSNGDWDYVDVEGSILMPTELIGSLSKTIAVAP